ncbi:MAG: hypothetical protein ACXWF8_18510 [Methylobacter sp.]
MSNAMDCSSVGSAKQVLPNIITKLEFEPLLAGDDGDLEGIDDNGAGWQEF